ncbi:MAG: hypothetical protein U0M06_12110, partial [Clostridia bacterium]|nr:hypothetical protein [Clostridia bacterium]
LKIGLVPCRRDVTPRPGIFNWEIAEERGRKIVDYICKNFVDEGVTFVDIDDINSVATMINEGDAEKIKEKFAKEKVDAIFVINANFGNEEAIAELAKFGKPICLWAPADDRFDADGSRYTDSQCGIFGASRLLQRNNIPFSHINTCAVDTDTFKRGFEKFLSVSCMVKCFTGLKIMQVGTRPRPFYSVIFNEGELMQKFGVRCIPVNIGVVIDKFNKILAERDEELCEGAKLIESRFEIDEQTRPNLKKMYAFVLLYKELADEIGTKIISAECWTAMQLAVGAMPCTAYSILADMGYIISCESDLHGAISMLLLSAASRGKKVPFFGEFTVRHPENKNGELLWHCGPFAYSLRDPESPAKNVNMRPWYKIKDGKYTVARLDQDNGKYSIINGTCVSVPGPYTFGTYLWAGFDNLDKWEDKLIDGPYIHHCAEIEGDYTEEIAEFTKYVPGIANDRA